MDTMTIPAPEGFDVEGVDQIPLDVFYAYQKSRWFWLRDLIVKAEDGEVLRVTCPSKREAELAYQSMRNEHTYRRLPDSSLTMRKAAKDGADKDGPWYLYIQKNKKE